MINSSTPTPKLYLDARSNLSCDYHRILLPYQHLSNVSIKSPIFWVNRMTRRGVEFVKMIKKKGVKVVVDLDDNFNLGIDHPLHDYWYSSGMHHQIVEQTKLADVVTVTNVQLADVAMQLNKNVVVVPNALPFDQGQFTRSMDKHTDTRAIYACGPSHGPDLDLLDDDSDITVVGLKKENMSFKYKDLLPSESYMQVYDGHYCALAPLVDNAFNNCKSNLKLLEAGAKGIPLFASKCLPYYNETDKDIVQYVGYDQSWSKVLKQFTDSNLDELGQRTAEHVRKHYDLKDSNLIRKQVFESL